MVIIINCLIQCMIIFVHTVLWLMLNGKFVVYLFEVGVMINKRQARYS